MRYRMYIIFIIPLMCMVFTVTHALASNKIKIALFHTFSVADPQCYDPYGQNLSNSVKMALDDFMTKNEGIERGDVAFVKYDYGEDKLRAISVVDKAVKDGVIAGIGYVCSDYAILGGRRAQKLGLPLITPTSTDDRIASLGDYVFMASFCNSYQGEVLARFAHGDLKKRKAILITAADCAYCLSLAKAFKNTFSQLGGRIVGGFDILTTDSDFSEVVKSVKALPHDLIVIPNYAMQSAGIIAAMLNAGVNSVFLGGDGWNWNKKSYDIVGGQKFEAYMAASWWPDLSRKASRDFYERYKKLFKQDVVTVSAHGYDAASILLKALRSVPDYNRVSVMNALREIQRHEGVTGKFNYRGRSVPDKSLALVKISPDGLDLVKIMDPNEDIAQD